MNTVLSLTTNPLKYKNKINNQNQDVQEIVEQASKTIVPLGKITAFAARHPWESMEHKSFEQIARDLKGRCDVDIYPNDSMIKTAWNHGEIKKEFLELGLQNWLDDQNLELPRNVAEQYCRAVLGWDQPSSEEVSLTELNIAAKELSWITPKGTKKRFVQTFSQLIENQGETKMKELNSHMIKWCKLYCDESQAVWSMPNRKKGFYYAWKGLVLHDPALESSIRKRLSNLPDDAEYALKEVILALEIPYSDIQEYLEAHLLALPGWAGMMLWRSQQNDEEKTLLTEYLAVRLSLEWALIQSYLPIRPHKNESQIALETLIVNWIQWGKMSIHDWSKLSPTEANARLTLSHRFDNILRNRLWLEAWEKTYEDHLKETITTKLHGEPQQKTQSAMAQFVFCIDVRSEPFRRKLEESGPFETFGTAGFFGLPIETCKLGSAHRHPSLPVMFKPQMRVNEMSKGHQMEQYQQRRGAVHASTSTFRGMKQHVLAGLVLPEISGPWLALQTLARSFVPRKTGSVIHKVKKNWLSKPTTELSLNNTDHWDTGLSTGFSDKEKVSYVRQALKMMGLTENFAPLVVICGHGSQSTNNPYASSIDCGACGGASSEFNARVLATMCNLPEVRQALSMEGIMIPKDTVFIAAEHVTTTDQLRAVYVPELSKTARKAFKQIQDVMPKVRENASTERMMQLPNIGYKGKNPRAEAERFAEDWSEVRPEWGLARNATFIIGDRKLTEDCNLEGRAFLHTYSWQKDKNGTILANIIKGPATVTQWINLQYYASTVAPHYYGSGNKTTQTITSGVGVMQGNSSDLLSGLPWQSVMGSDHEFYHSPLRLLVLIQAPKDKIEKLIKQDPDFHQKVQNGWIRLASVDESGNWISWS